MKRDELTNADARRHLAGHVRNFVAAPGVQFSPWADFTLVYQDGQLCRVQPDKSRIPLFAAEEVYDKTDEQLEAMVLGLPMPEEK